MEENKPWYRRAWAIALFIVGILMLLGAGLFAWQTFSFYSQIKQGKEPDFIANHKYSGMRVAALDDQTTDDSKAMKAKVAGKGEDPFVGPATATHEIVEFLDFDCPYCKEAVGTVHDIMRLRPDVKFIVRDYPLMDIHPDAQNSAKAARCVWSQKNPSVYWRYYDLLYANQDQHDTDSLAQLAKQAGADTRFADCLKSTTIEGPIRQSMIDAIAAGVSVTPTFFVDGVKVEGAADTQTLLGMIGK